jgi:hypothetical protein
MRIYCAHAASFDYKNEWYVPLESLQNDGHVLTFPHKTTEFTNTKELIAYGVDLMLAEVSYPSTGLGIELGWANANDVPLLLVYRAGTTPSRSLNALNAKIVTYIDSEDLLRQLHYALRLYISH